MPALSMVERQILLRPCAQDENAVSGSKEGRIFIYSPIYQMWKEGLLCAGHAAKPPGVKEALPFIKLTWSEGIKV